MILKYSRFFGPMTKTVGLQQIATHRLNYRSNSLNASA